MDLGMKAAEPQGGESRVTTEGYRQQCWYLHDQTALQLKAVVVKKLILANLPISFYQKK